MNRQYNRSNYTYKLVRVYDFRIVSIIDQCNQYGGMSVTNNAEGVIDEIAQNAGIKKEKTIWIYRDTSGIWDEIRIENGVAQFYSINERDHEVAYDTVLRRHELNRSIQS